MDVRQLAAQYMSHYHLAYDVVKEEGHYDILMPYLLMDAGFHFVKKVSVYHERGLVKHKAAMYLGRWRTAGSRFFDSLFVAYPEQSDERADVIDLMDRMEDYIGHNVEIMQYCGGSCFIEYEPDIEDMLTSALMANFFSLNAYTQLRFLYHDARMSRASWSKFQNILRNAGAVLQNSKNFSVEIMEDRGASEVAGRRLEELNRAQKAINNQVRLWVKTEIANNSQ